MKKILMLAGLLAVSGVSYAAEGKAVDMLRSHAGAADISIPEPALAAVLEKADLPLRGMPGATPYEKVKNLFESGRPATKEELTGWHSGRDFTSDGAIRATLIIGQAEKSILPGGGPLFDEDAFKMYNDGRALESPSFYDKMEPSLIEQLLSKAKDPREGIFLKFPEATGGSGDYVLVYRKAGDYIVAKVVISGIYVSYSYYFKDVTPW